MTRGEVEMTRGEVEMRAASIDTLSTGRIQREGQVRARKTVFGLRYSDIGFRESVFGLRYSDIGFRESVFGLRYSEYVQLRFLASLEMTRGRSR
jgi:hypothetical protein